jgi:DNA-binding MarR family transcriptional regulator
MIRTAQAKATETKSPAPEAAVKAPYLEALAMVERAHRGLLDVVKDEFDRRGRSDVNATQALILFHMGDAELTAGELKTRGYYLGSNVSYNLKKLVDLGYVHHEKSRVDRRTVRIKLTEKGQQVRAIVESLYERHTRSIEQVGQISRDDFERLTHALQRLERFWVDQIRFRL